LKLHGYAISENNVQQSLERLKISEGRESELDDEEYDNELGGADHQSESMSSNSVSGRSESNKCDINLLAYFGQNSNKASTANYEQLKNHDSSLNLPSPAVSNYKVD